MVLVKVGISAISAENALQNLSEEIPHWDFNKTLSETQSIWEKELSKIKVEASDKNKIIFYTALYHSLLAPYLYNDVNKSTWALINRYIQPKGSITIQCCRCGILSC